METRELKWLEKLDKFIIRCLDNNGEIPNDNKDVLIWVRNFISKKKNGIMPVYQMEALCKYFPNFEESVSSTKELKICLKVYWYLDKISNSPTYNIHTLVKGMVGGLQDIFKEDEIVLERLYIFLSKGLYSRKDLLDYLYNGSLGNAKRVSFLKEVGLTEYSLFNSIYYDRYHSKRDVNLFLNIFDVGYEVFYTMGKVASDEFLKQEVEKFQNGKLYNINEVIVHLSDAEVNILNKILMGDTYASLSRKENVSSLQVREIFLSAISKCQREYEKLYNVSNIVKRYGR